MPATRARQKKLTARTADKHDLYQKSVQAPDTDSRFFARYFKRYTGRNLRVFREDFCGTFTLSTHFVQLHRENQAVCIDLDGATLDWGRKHNLAPLTPHQQQRVHIFEEDVLAVNEPQADLICAMNFSYCIFKKRAELNRYIQAAFDNLQRGGLMCMDIWGGSETQVLQEEEREVDGFTYIWDQHAFDPLTYECVCKIHFEFEDGSRMRNAFVYDWRLWTPPDLREAFEAAGFQDIHFLWEATDLETGEGNGVFRRKQKGDPDDAWIAYIVGYKP
jgi:SAM-dependent methyltransferase